MPTYAVLVSGSGEILDIRTHYLNGGAATGKLKGRPYIEQCHSRYRAAIKGLLSHEQPLLSGVMPPPTLGIDAWFAVVGVPLGASPESGALFVHMDISPWVANHGAPSDIPTEISIGLLQRAMASTFVGTKSAEANGEMRRVSSDGLASLTKRQLEVLKLIGEGKTNVEIAEDLSCALNTVKRHVTAVLQKLKLPNRTRAAMIANQITD
ncbi:MAG: LuxR C-terminal-related transcriptional regulator [Hyphomicrobium sp.]|uniref:helix-turn-helix transcriptional regulator n=1 Tax=Hyphomicrobium sp. TaxID=82 RepID=UPI0039E54E2B